jgi:hypothetical protein
MITNPKLLRPAVLFLAMVTGLWSQSAYALRPYEGTDASVAPAHEFELEFSPVGYAKSASGRTLVGPFAVANWGIAGDTEIVLEGRLERQQGGMPDGYRTRLGDTALSVKHLFRHGSLQDGSGVSIAGECGVLLPEYHGSKGKGAVCTGVVSQKFGIATVHLNAALSRTREKEAGRFAGVIIEGGGEDAALRPVTEIYTARDTGGSRVRSALVGMIWKHSEDLAFDAGIRKAREDGELVTEVRVGLTWAYAMH